MTEIIYTDKENNEITFSFELSEILYLRLDGASKNPIFASYNENEYDGDPKDHYYYYEFETSKNPLLAYLLYRKYINQELDENWHEIELCYDIIYNDFEKKPDLEFNPPIINSLEI
ncbi:MAG: hypothetical protein U9R03_04530 [Candidatus Aerophobetes bacterium]|nr:hypothetical protein [Candidatus Aerophobetes bacterium]